jgi:hypothetical protein
MKKAYGQEGVDAVRKSQLMKLGVVPPSLEDIQKKTDVKITGNTAKVNIPRQTQPMRLVKATGKWKVQLFKPGQMQGPQAQMAAAMMKSKVSSIKKARKNIGKPGYDAKKIMAMVNSSMMPGPGMIPSNMKLPKGVKRPKRAR